MAKHVPVKQLIPKFVGTWNCLDVETRTQKRKEIEEQLRDSFGVLYQAFTSHL
jgi:hypothetical protein